MRLMSLSRLIVRTSIGIPPEDVHDRSAIMVCKVTFGAKILPLNIKVECKRVQLREHASLYVIEQIICKIPARL